MSKPKQVRRVSVPAEAKQVYPPDFKSKVAPVSAPTPGELELDTNGQLFKRYLQMMGLSFLTNPYNDLIRRDMPYFLCSPEIKLANGSTVNFVEMKWKEATLTPREAYHTDSTLDIEISVSLVHNLKGTTTPVGEVHIFRLPIPRGCFLDPTRKAKTPEELIALGVSPADLLGYFIIRGKARIIKLYQYLRNNQVLIYTGPRHRVVKRGATSLKLQARLTYQTVIRSMIIYFEVGKGGNIRVLLPFFSKKTKKNKVTGDEEISGSVMMPIFSIIRIFFYLYLPQEYLDKQDYINLITRMVPENRRAKITQALYPSLVKVMGSKYENLAGGIADDFTYYKEKS